MVGAVEQLAEAQRHLLDKDKPLPQLLSYVEYLPPKKHPQVKRRIRDYSVWDPDPVEQELQVSRCRACLLEILRRAAHDWVLYRTHSSIPKRQLAEHAYTWLFEEGPEHPWWKQRHSEGGQPFTSFLSICEILDLEPVFVRERVKKLTPREIMTAGRPAERRGKTREEPAVTEYEVTDSVRLDEIDFGEDPYRTSYERQFAVGTLGYL